MEPRPPRSQTNPPPVDASPMGRPEAGPPPEQAAPDDTAVFRPDYGPVARVPPTGDPINLRPAPPAEVPPPAPRRQSRALWFAVLAGIGIIALLLVATIATVAWIGSGNNDDGAEVVGAAPTQTQEAEMALIADLRTQVAAAATPAGDPTEENLLSPPTELPPTVTEPAASASTATAAPVATATAAPADQAVAGAGLAEGTAVDDLLPIADDLPAELVVTDDSALTTVDEVAESFSDPTDATARLEAWGWEANASRIFELPDGSEVSASGLTFLYVSVHRFGSAAAAQEALSYFADELVSGTDMQPSDGVAVGETSLGLVGPSDEGVEVGALYVQQGPFLMRVGTFASNGAALGEAVDVTRVLLDRAGA